MEGSDNKIINQQLPATPGPTVMRLTTTYEISPTVLLSYTSPTNCTIYLNQPNLLANSLQSTSTQA